MRSGFPTGSSKQTHARLKQCVRASAERVGFFPREETVLLVLGELRIFISAASSEASPPPPLPPPDCAIVYVQRARSRAGAMHCRSSGQTLREKGVKPKKQAHFLTNKLALLRHVLSERRGGAANSLETSPAKPIASPRTHPPSLHSTPPNTI